MGASLWMIKTPTMAEQLIFDFPRKTAFGRDDFFVSDANQWAVDAIEGWVNWPLGKLILVGPSGAGKIHLARIWCDMSGAQIITVAELAGAPIPPAYPLLGPENTQLPCRQ